MAQVARVDVKEGQQACPSAPRMCSPYVPPGTVCPRCMARMHAKFLANGGAEIERRQDEFYARYVERQKTRRVIVEVMPPFLAVVIMLWFVFFTR